MILTFVSAFHFVFCFADVENLEKSLDETERLHNLEKSILESDHQGDDVQENSDDESEDYVAGTYGSNPVVERKLPTHIEEHGAVSPGAFADANYVKRGNSLVPPSPNDRSPVMNLFRGGDARRSGKSFLDLFKKYFLIIISFFFQGFFSSENSYVRTFKKKNIGEKSGIIIRVDYFKFSSVSAENVPSGPAETPTNADEDQSDAESLHLKKPEVAPEPADEPFDRYTVAQVVSTLAVSNVDYRPIYTTASSGGRRGNVMPYNLPTPVPSSNVPQFQRPFAPMNVASPVIVTTSAFTGIIPQGTPARGPLNFDAPPINISTMADNAKQKSKRRSNSGKKNS